MLNVDSASVGPHHGAAKTKNFQERPRIYTAIQYRVEKGTSRESCFHYSEIAESSDNAMMDLYR